jgi:hypothetical protein
MLSNTGDQMELYKQYSDNPSLKAWLQNMVFNTNYNDTGASL